MEYSNYVLENLSISTWKHRKDLLNDLKEIGVKTTPRQIRFMIQKNNRDYANGISDYVIVHGIRGYKKTNNWNEIEPSIADQRRKALTMLVETLKIEKEYKRRNKTRATKDTQDDIDKKIDEINFLEGEN